MKSGQPQTCPVCIAAQKRKKVPAHLRKEQPLPCEKHGDPRTVRPDVRVYLALYGLIRPYHECRYTKDNDPVFYVNLSLLRELTTELKLPYFQALEYILLIHAHLDGKDNQ